MKNEHPILMCNEMIHQIKSGQKTETRRTANLKEINQEPFEWRLIGTNPRGNFIFQKSDGSKRSIRSPYGISGHTLWVRESFRIDPEDGILFRADIDDMDNPHPEYKWKPSLFLRREHCRITAEVVDVSLKHLQSITHEEAKAEGLWNVESFMDLWIKINGIGSWNTNPWVWIIRFGNVVIRK